MNGQRFIGSRKSFLLLGTVALFCNVTAQPLVRQARQARVRVVCPLTIGGSFEATTTSFTGSLAPATSRPVTYSGDLAVDLRTLDSGITLRNDHLRNKYLEVAKGGGFERAILSDISHGESVGPGRADSTIHGDGRQAFAANGRFQVDFGPRKALVVSGLYRNASRLEPRNAASGAAFGFAPAPRLSVWTEADAEFREGVPLGPAYIFLNETALEVFRGVWLKFSPQMRLVSGSASARQVPMLVGADLLPRTYWNVDVSYYMDRNRPGDPAVTILLAQLHLYI